MKIRPTIDVPDGDECMGCIYAYNEHADIYSCLIFDTYPENGKKLPQCAEDSVFVELLEGIIDRLRGQLQNCVDHLEHAKRRQYSRNNPYDKVISDANKALYETFNVQLFPVYRQGEQVNDKGD